MEGRNEQLLINYLDRALEEREMREMEALINSDKETHKQWQFLQLAVDAVEYSAIYDQVASVRENFRTIQPVEVLQTSNKKPARIFRMSRALRVAAAVLLLMVGAGSWKFFTVNATRVYEQAFIGYTLPTTRGQATITDIEEAYRLQNWNAVIATIDRLSLADNKALFLSGMANLQLKQYAEASMLFEQILQNNTQAGKDLYHDEAQYYLALSELGGHNTQQAVKLFQQIQADKGHKYHAQAEKIGNLDLQILKIKASR
jgi:predicted translin family RNA/ssDNA-binding protein